MFVGSDSGKHISQKQDVQDWGASATPGQTQEHVLPDRHMRGMDWNKHDPRPWCHFGVALDCSGQVCLNGEGLSLLDVERM